MNDAKRRWNLACEAFTTRPGTIDHAIVREQWGAYGALDLVGRTVLDLGANIGAFIGLAAACGAKAVLGYEPEPTNYALAQKNAAAVVSALESRMRVELVDSAVVADNRMGLDQSSIELFTATKTKNHGLHSTAYKFRGRDTQIVPAVKFSKAVLARPFDVVKCDVEGEEQFYEWELLPAAVTQLAMEIHLKRPDWRVMTDRLVDRLEAMGFEWTDGTSFFRDPRKAIKDGKLTSTTVWRR